MKPFLKRFVNRYIAPPIVFTALLLLGYTLRVKVVGAENDDIVKKRQCVIAFWHCHLMYLPFHFRWRWNIWLLVSTSADGEISRGVNRLFGIRAVMGSTYEKPGSSLLSLARKMKKGYSTALTIDGSRGPARKAQPGAIYLSKLAQKPIVPVAIDAERKKVLNSWDKTIIPLPFSKVNFVIGNPISVDPKAKGEELDKKIVELENELNRITELAGSSF